MECAFRISSTDTHEFKSVRSRSRATSYYRRTVKKSESTSPPLNEQIRIAKILDKFETMTVSITEGLPREIELRQKQYEYYRDMLFSFPKPDVAEA